MTQPTRLSAGGDHDYVVGDKKRRVKRKEMLVGGCRVLFIQLEALPPSLLPSLSPARLLLEAGMQAGTLLFVDKEGESGGVMGHLA